MNDSVTKAKFDNLFGCRVFITKVDPINTLQALTSPELSLAATMALKDISLLPRPGLYLLYLLPAAGVCRGGADRSTTPLQVDKDITYCD